MIAESMFADCDVDGNQHVLIDEVVDHKSDDSAVLDADRFVVVRKSPTPSKWPSMLWCSLLMENLLLLGGYLAL